MQCVYCQNYTFSQLSSVGEVSIEELTGMMLILQKRGCHNINLVTPTHFVPQIMEALLAAIRKGLTIPIVYNTSGYDLVETLRLLDGVVDCYLPDMRYGTQENAKRFSDAPDYVTMNQGAVTEMFRQVGTAVMDEHDILQRGLIIRHLVLPNGYASTEQVFKYIAERLSRDVSISLMSQYCPVHRAHEFPEINRRITKKEYEEAIDLFHEYGLVNGWVQSSSDEMDLKLLGTNIKKM